MQVTFKSMHQLGLIFNSSFSFVEMHALVRLVDDEATAIIPVARIIANTISEKKLVKGDQ